MTGASWIVVRDTHEALVSREMFEQVQSIRNQVAEDAKSSAAKKNPYTENIFRGRIFCGHCGRPLNRHRDNKQGSYSFNCIANQRMGKDACSQNTYIREDTLFHLVLTIIRQKAKAVIGRELYMKCQDSKIAAKKAEVDQEIDQLRRDTEKNRALLAGLYENFVTGVLTKAEYLELKENYSGRVQAAVEQVRELQIQQNTLDAWVKNCTSLADKLAAAEKDKTLSSRLPAGGAGH